MEEDGKEGAASEGVDAPHYGLDDMEEESEHTRLGRGCFEKALQPTLKENEMLYTDQNGDTLVLSVDHAHQDAWEGSGDTDGLSVKTVLVFQDMVARQFPIHDEYAAYSALFDCKLWNIPHMQKDKNYLSQWAVAITKRYATAFPLWVNNALEMQLRKIQTKVVLDPAMADHAPKGYKIFWPIILKAMGNTVTVVDAFYRICLIRGRATSTVEGFNSGVGQVCRHKQTGQATMAQKNDKLRVWKNSPPADAGTWGTADRVFHGEDYLPAWKAMGHKDFISEETRCRGVLEQDPMVQAKQKQYNDKRAKQNSVYKAGRRQETRKLQDAVEGRAVQIRPKKAPGTKRPIPVIVPNDDAQADEAAEPRALRAPEMESCRAAGISNFGRDHIPGLSAHEAAGQAAVNATGGSRLRTTTRMACENGGKIDGRRSPSPGGGRSRSPSPGGGRSRSPSPSSATGTMQPVPITATIPEDDAEADEAAEPRALRAPEMESCRARVLRIFDANTSPA
jgi:hypothetical protein